MIDLSTFLFSVVLGLPIGIVFGSLLAQWTNEQFAKQVFEAMVTLRAEARKQMEEHAALQKGSHWNVKRD